MGNHSKLHSPTSISSNTDSHNMDSLSMASSNSMDNNNSMASHITRLSKFLSTHQSNTSNHPQ